eukprot:CAMPEP_0180644608 /NCGR_PEP_ID=MMETSP1037_2-20121125/48503_1 /TAXON_ID=632150 /ORGANISM="Azadinium spinosum, Strain 3D9" /LENGTH=351 /DNA_ID=CAMNT_0022668323 /DNA_START=58 /DNA_END=1109 /DNA_ORIENTATION=-
MVSLRSAFWPTGDYASMEGFAFDADSARMSSMSITGGSLKPDDVRKGEEYTALLCTSASLTEAQMAVDESTLIAEFLEERHAFVLWALQRIDEATREHKYITSKWSDVPQAIAATIYSASNKLNNGRSSSFVVLSLAMSFVKVFFLLYVRPRVLIALAKAGQDWPRMSTWDLELVMQPRYHNDFPWQLRYICLKRVFAQPNVAETALMQLGLLFKQAPADSSMTVWESKKQAFLYELRAIAKDGSQGKELVQSAKEIFVDLCPGLEAKDIFLEVPQSAGNLGYTPAGADSKEAQNIVEEMHNGADLKELLKKKKLLSKRPHRLGGAMQAHRPKEFVVIFTDLEPDDAMAIA